jgi:hypothetical protein
MQDLIASGGVADVVLLVMALEAIALFALFRSDGPQLLGLSGNLVGGAALVLALRFALTGAQWPWIASALLASMAGHIVDLAIRVRRSGELTAHSERQP